MLEAIKNLARSGAADPQNGAALGFLRPINTDRMAAGLDIEWKAVQNGRKNLPDSESNALDAVEQDIIQKIESEWTWHGGELVNNLRAYATRLSGFSIEAEFAELRVKADNACTALRAAHHRAEAALGHFKSTYIDARREYDDFRKRHKLVRPVRNPSGRWTTIGLLFIIVAFEAVLNGFFFAAGAVHGLVGGVGTALGISLANVIFAFLLGFGPARWMHRRNWLIKLPGFLFTLVGLALIIGLHAFAAQLRDATAGVGEAHATTVAINRLTSMPWLITDFSSYYLFALGLLFAVAALWKGYAFDDPYPGYGATFRRADAAREVYAEEHAELFDELGDIKDGVIKAIETGLTRIPLFPQQAAAIRAQRDAILQNFRGYEFAVQRAGNQLLAQYREKNCEHRTAPAPFHFSRNWELPYSMLASAEVKKLTAEPGHRPVDIGATLDQLRVLSASILAEYEALLAKYPHASQMS